MKDLPAFLLFAGILGMGACVFMPPDTSEWFAAHLGLLHSTAGYLAVVGAVLTAAQLVRGK